MKHPIVMKMIMRRYGLNRKQLFKKLDEENIGALLDEVTYGCCPIDSLVTVLDALGYQLVFQPKGSETVPEWCYPIRWSDYNGIAE